MAKIRNIMILLGIVLIITVIALIIVYNINLKQQDYFEIVEDEGAVENVIEPALQPVQSKMDFYTIRNIVHKYYLYYDTILNLKDYYATDIIEVLSEAETQNLSTLFNMLDQEYIRGKGITTNNLKSKLTQMKISDINITDILVSEKSDNVNIYLVKGILNDEINNGRKHFQIIIKIDIESKLFSIIPQDYVEEKYNDLEEGKEIDVSLLDSISENKNNKFTFKSVTDETYIKDLFSQLKIELQHFTELVYNKLDESYKNKTFATLEEFDEYVKGKKETYSTMQVTEYQKIIKDGYTQYICTDKNRNYYIFRETAPFKYTVMLDNYVIPTEDFTEEYNSSSAVEKVVLNIKRFFMGIDDKNYGYSYSVLSETFKANKYPTKNDFINYAKQNFFEKNEIEYISYEKENGLYIYKIRISDATGSSQEKKELNMILKLNSGTNFEMSFGEN